MRHVFNYCRSTLRIILFHYYFLPWVQFTEIWSYIYNNSVVLNICDKYHPKVYVGKQAVLCMSIWLDKLSNFALFGQFEKRSTETIHALPFNSNKSVVIKILRQFP